MIEDYIKYKIEKNNLPFVTEKLVDVINNYHNKETYRNFSKEQLFYQYILNEAGKIIASIDINIAEHFGYLKPIKSHYDSKIIYYEFFTEEDYYEWLNNRISIYEKITNEKDLRILNYVELCTINFVKDITTTYNYKLLNNKMKTIKSFKKEGYGVDIQKNVSFIQFLSHHFNKKINFSPVNE